MPKCKNCNTKFVAKRFLQKFCMETEECQEAAIKFTLDHNKQLKEKKEADDWKVKKKEMVEGLKKMGDYESDLQVEINAICRLLDEGNYCISCGKSGKPQAGHYHSRGANTTLRFNLNNLHLQCYRCNVELSANITGYNLGLIDWYGKAYQEYVEYELPKEYPLLKWSKNDLILWAAQARAFKKEVIKLERPLSEEDRIFWRHYYNKKIGIYTNNNL